ncbi:MAG TPA: hypothetical protein VFA05_05705 [Gaiellaceae bacterium]|nr:hypothetical protein [Gaiellaceae bacterium]
MLDHSPDPASTGLAPLLAPLAPLRCIECRRPWTDATQRWRMKVTEDDVPEAVLYCATCAHREFGPPR